MKIKNIRKDGRKYLYGYMIANAKIKNKQLQLRRSEEEGGRGELRKSSGTIKKLNW